MKSILKSVFIAILLISIITTLATSAGGLRTVDNAAQAANVVTLAWDANTESDLAGYKVYWGKATGVYTNSPIPTVAPSATPTYTTPVLANGTWYFAVTAYNTAGLESGYSNEVSKVISTAPAPPKNLRFWQQVISWLKGIFNFLIT
jgi:hypothetical protein